MNTFSTDRWKRALSLFLSVAAPLALAQGCGREATVALEDPIRNIARSETNVDVLKSWVVAGVEADVLIHIDSSDDMRAFPSSYGETIKNTSDHLRQKNISVLDQISQLIEHGGTVNLGYKAGLFKRVVWVLPASVSVGENPVQSFKEVLVQRRGFTPVDLTDLARDGKYISGRIAGIPITITNLEDLEIPPEESSIIDIDLGFFIGLKEQSAGNRMGTRVLIDVLRSLKRKSIRCEEVSINLQSLTGLIPMDIRFFGNVMTEIFMEPGILEGALPPKYTMMIEAEEALIAGDKDRAEALYLQLTERYPSDAGLYFSLAITRAFKEKGEESAKALLKAYDLDSAYLRGFFQLGRVLAVNGKIEAGERIMKSPELKTLIPEEELDYQMGVFYFNAQQYFDAITYFELVAEKRPKDFALMTVMYQTYKGTDNIPQMVRILEKMIKTDENRVIRDMPWVFKDLGKVSEELRVYMRAREAYEKYLQYVPGDPDADELKAKIELYKGYR